MKKRKSRAKQFTEEQIERYRKDPNVRHVDDHTIRFIYEFRIQLYEAWQQEKRQGIKRILIENGYSLKELGDNFIASLDSKFKKYGRPSNAKSNQPVGSINAYYRSNPDDNEYLLNTGKFIKSGKGISFSEEFKEELFKSYPERSIEEGIQLAGIDPQKVGYQRIHALRRLFEGGDTVSQRISYSEAVIEKYRNHPYIKSITSSQLRCRDAFYNEACFLIEAMKINEVLDLYEIDPRDIPVSVQTNLKYKLDHWKRTEEKMTCITVQLLRIQQRRLQKLNELVEERFRKIREEEVPAMDCRRRKALCIWIRDYPKDPQGIVTTSLLLKRTGISRSSYYSILRNDDYGSYEQYRQEQDDEDIKVIKEVMTYKKFRKGVKQIYMMMEDVTGQQFSIKKIRRLMKKYGVSSGIREKKESRIEARQNLEKHKKPDLLKRRFRIARPNSHTLTDVTYMTYGDNKLAYGSAIRDAVTGRMYDLTIREYNDLDLVMTSLESLKAIHFKPNAIFHSDQGALYLNETYQNAIRSLGLEQSMSKRGNCLDNAPQESFFALFKTETSYRECKDIIELQELCSNYLNYFNNERRQWDRCRMTPIEYENYLNTMKEAEFEEYLVVENEKYCQMKMRAAQHAIKRAQTLGV